MIRLYSRRNSGGQNRSHEQAESFPRADSFELAKTGTWSGILCGGRFWETYKDGDCCELFPPHATEGVEIPLSRKRNGYGGTQLFFLCPQCGQRVRFLYFMGRRGFLCRKCAKLNYRSQQQTRGGMVYYDAGMRYADRYLETWTCVRPDGFSFCEWMPNRPRYMHRSTYQKHLVRLSKFQINHGERLIADLAKILKL